MLLRLIFIAFFSAITAFSQIPAIETGVSQELAKWRAARYSNISYKLNLTLEKMSPVLKGTIEIRVTVSEPGAVATGLIPPIILDWRKIKGHEGLSVISSIFLNGKQIVRPSPQSITIGDPDPFKPIDLELYEFNEHLVFRDGVKMGENVILLDFTSPILTSGSAITRYIDKEDGSEYIYSLFVPSDASTAFPVFDQPDLKAYFNLEVDVPKEWNVLSNGSKMFSGAKTIGYSAHDPYERPPIPKDLFRTVFFHSGNPISTYVFAFAAGPFERTSDCVSSPHVSKGSPLDAEPLLTCGLLTPATDVFVRKSQATKFKPHAAEVFRLNREAVKYLETYFDYKFPFPKYDLVLIPEFPFGGMEHAGATFLREQSIIFPQEPTKNDIITRANLIFHEAAHQWFGDTVTMKWFDDLWLKEGFATFMAYKALDKIMPEANAWKVFYERVKQAAYQTDSTRGTTAIYQPIANLSAAKSAYGNIVYNKAPAFLRQAEFYLGEDKFQTAVRAFLKKHEFANAGWEDLVKEFETASNKNLTYWANGWVTKRGMPIFRMKIESQSKIIDMRTSSPKETYLVFSQSDILKGQNQWIEKLRLFYIYENGKRRTEEITFNKGDKELEEYWGTDLKGFASKETVKDLRPPQFIFPNYQDYGYGIFLLDDKSRDYVLKNIQNEKDDFLRTMMWGSLWDSVREAELDPKDYVELVLKNLATEKDESTIQTLLNRVTTAMNYYVSDTGGNAVNTRVSARSDLRSRLENLLIDKIQNASTQGQRITYYRAFLNIASTDRARDILKQILKAGSGTTTSSNLMTLKTKDKFDIVTRLAILGDADAPKLLADLQKTETSDDAKRYAYAAHAAFATPENKAKFWNDFVNNKDISESWIESAIDPFNSIRHSDLTQQYLSRALAELPNLKRTRKIFFINNWLAEFIGGQRDEKALGIINKFLADNPNLDNDLRLKILENSDLLERAVKIRAKYGKN